jgi:glycosyltransferase involved in cell wall biosynthesis
MISALPAHSPGAGPRIGYVLSLFPSYDETFILREMKALASRGVELRVFSLRSRRQALVQEDARPFLSVTVYAGYLSGEVLAATVRALRRSPRAFVELLALILAGSWRHPVRLAKNLAFLPKAFRFSEVAAAEGLQRLHAHWATYPATVALVMSRVTGIPWSLTCHAHDIFLNPSLLPEKLERADLVLTCTADNKRHLRTVSPSADSKVRISYHGLDLRLFQPDPSRIPAQPPRLLAVGSLLECKGFDILLRACALLRESGDEFLLTIAGGGPEERRLREDAARLGLDRRVRFTGYLTQKELVPLYRDADLFVLPAVLEIHWGIPNVLVEALACGVPVVTTPLPSLPELIEDGREGLVARNRDPRDVAEKVGRLLRDPALRRRMGQAGRARVEERFDVERTIGSVVDSLVGMNHAAL